MTNFLESGFNDYEVRKLQKGETIKSVRLRRRRPERLYHESCRRL